MSVATLVETLPNFLVIGAMRSGSTSLYAYLKTHPQVYVPRTKELHFFVAERNWLRGLEWYGEHFVDGSGMPARGECSVTYTEFPIFEGVPERIAQVIPHVTLLYIVRDPVERIRSHYELLLAAGHERRDFDSAVRERPAYIETTRYAAQLDRYLEHFGREQLHVVTTESLIGDTADTLRGICTFIGVDPDAAAPVYKRASSRDAKSAPGDEGRRFAGPAPVQIVASKLPRSTKQLLKRRAPRQPLPDVRTEAPS